VFIDGIIKICNSSTVKSDDQFRCELTKNAVINTHVVSTDVVLKDFPLPQGHLKDKFWWPWPQSGVALAFALKVH